MKPVYVIGDCHLARVGEHDYKKVHPFNLTIWGRAGLKAWGLNLDELYKNKELSSGPEVGEGERIPFDKIKDDGIVISWIGYVDIRQFLPKYNNADFLAEQYIKHLKQYFKNSKIVIVEPLGQFDKMYLKYEGISPSYTFDERKTQNDLFIESLNKYCRIYGIKDIITQKEIFNAIGTEILNDSVLRKVAPHPSDALKESLNYNIYQLFLEKINIYQNSLCPQCKNFLVSAVNTYPSDSIFEMVDKKELYWLGSCLRNVDDPYSYCFNCNRGFDIKI